MGDPNEWLNRIWQLVEFWGGMQQSAWWAWLVEARLAIALIVLPLLLVLAWLVGRGQKQRRTQIMLLAVNDATFGHSVARSKTGAWGFAVSIEPPPERFREFNISYQPMSIFDPVDFCRRVLGGRKPVLQIAGVLNGAPTAEIVWWRGQPPARALGVKPGRAPWVLSRLDYARVEYALRGTNVAAIKHAFQDLIARFAPILVSITVQRERRPQVRLVASGRIEARDVSPLITGARTLGRAAMLQ